MESRDNHQSDYDKRHIITTISNYTKIVRISKLILVLKKILTSYRLPTYGTVASALQPLPFIQTKTPPNILRRGKKENALGNAQNHSYGML